MSQIKKISTTALSKKLELSKHELDEILLRIKYICKTDDGIDLTELGKSNGGNVQEHKTYGKYIVWPENIEIPKELINLSQTYFTSTKIASKYKLSAQKINMLLSEIGFIEKHIKGWNITALGIKNGGLQKENTKNGIPYVEWNESLYASKAFISVLDEVQGNAGENTQEQVDKFEDSNFREKFQAKHRATDGHFVRSKAEMLIDNWLYMEGIVHAYERKLPIEEEMYCDFYIPTSKVYIEFWGLENEPKYIQRKRVKKAIYEKYNFKLIELTDKEVFNLDDVLPKMLLKFGVQTY